MNLNDYFSPVALEKPAGYHLSDQAIFFRNIRVHTPDEPIEQIGQYDVAIMGVGDDRNAMIKGSAGAPDQIRAELYLLYKLNSLKIIDLGNLVTGPTIHDSYYAIRDVVDELVSHKVIPIVLGGSQDMTYGSFLGLEGRLGRLRYVTLDSHLDMGIIEDEIRPESYLIPILSTKKDSLLHFTNLGHQRYFVDQKDLDFLFEQQHETVRLGILRKQLSGVEPILRDADLVSMDINSVRQCDAPASMYPSPNGLTGEEICQLANYAGRSDHLSAFGIYNIIPERDLMNQTVKLAAQVIWYFMEGIQERKTERPRADQDNFKQFMVKMEEVDQDVIFYRSMHTDRWWMEIPETKNGKKRNILVACSYEDYQKACNREIPDRWYMFYRKLN